MKPDYKNWMPKGMIYTALAGTAVFLILFIVFGVSGLVNPGKLKTFLFIIFLLGTVTGIFSSVWMILMYRAFSYNGNRQMSRQIIEGIAGYVNLPEGGKGLDVGCGSGALAIACAKRNPKAQFVGIDRWGKEYASFSKTLCENNAKAEGVSNVRFKRGDAVKLDFADETFDAVVSNYVYHNIPTNDRQKILLETLRTLKKGGTFAIHDIFSKAKYGDMQEFVKKLKDMGYEKAELIDTTDGKFITKSESKWMALSGSAILTGKK
ncbi:MAG: class I SAM-dependent methyltransferase [Clostridia bacterium]|nr:class I SAM-dependent methyltransferase [Clostridia bacterium]